MIWTISALEHKRKSKNKNATDECRYFLESNFVGINGLFVLTYTNQDGNAKRYKGSRYYLPKGIIKNYNVIIIGKDVYKQSIDSDVKRYKEIRKFISQGVRLYYWVFIEFCQHQEPLQTNSSWFE